MFNAEFKAALALLPSKEKDKLLWRLLKRDELLAHRLEYELLAPYDAVDKRNELAEKMKDVITSFVQSGMKLSGLLSQFRYFSGDITRHVYITKDKVGEVQLNFILLQEAMKLLNKPLHYFSSRNVQKYIMYMMNKLYRTCILINKLHPDYHLELENNAEQLGNILNENKKLMRYVNYIKFDVNWLLDFDIPDDIESYYKTIKEQRLLG